MVLNKIKYYFSKNLTTSQLINRSFLRKEARKLKGNILDLGSGTGEYSLLMAKNPDNQVVALDGSEKLSVDLQKKVDQLKIKNLKVIHSDAHQLPFEDNSFDSCFCNTVLEHVKDPEQIVKEVRRVLKPEGKLMISIPFLQEIHADPDDFQRYTPFGLQNLLRKNGFQIIKQHCDYGALNTLEYLLLGSFIWRLRLGLKKNFPFGYVYILWLMIFFFIFKISHWVFFPLQKKDKHFFTMVVLIGVKK